MNNISILGRLGSDVQLSFSKDNKAIGKFSVGVTRQFDKTKTDWFNCVAFGKSAELIEQYVKKGQQIAITGSIQFGSYDAKDGTKKYTTDLIVGSFNFVGNKSDSNNNSNSSNNQNSFEADMTPVDDGDMPF